MTIGSPSRSIICSVSGPDGIALTQSRSRLETQILGMVPSSPGIRCSGIRGTNRSTISSDTWMCFRSKMLPPRYFPVFSRYFSTLSAIWSHSFKIPPVPSGSSSSQTSSEHWFAISASF